jgi:hypothetical protein
VTTQPTLPFDDEPGDQRAHLARVRSRIGAAVLAFLRQRVALGLPEFVMEELHNYCRGIHGIAPASPDRVLRDLRTRGECDYTVVNRRQSRYKILSVAEAKGEVA